jgi:hypothetical protein
MQMIACLGMTKCKRVVYMKKHSRFIVRKVIHYFSLFFAKKSQTWYIITAKKRTKNGKRFACRF